MRKPNQVVLLGTVVSLLALSIGRWTASSNDWQDGSKAQKQLSQSARVVSVKRNVIDHPTCQINTTGDDTRFEQWLIGHGYHPVPGADHHGIFDVGALLAISSYSENVQCKPEDMEKTTCCRYQLGLFRAFTGDHGQAAWEQFYSGAVMSPYGCAEAFHDLFRMIKNPPKCETTAPGSVAN